MTSTANDENGAAHDPGASWAQPNNASPSSLAQLAAQKMENPARRPHVEPVVERPEPTSVPGTGGRFAPGNQAAFKTGLYSRKVSAGELEEQAEARAALAEREAAILVDLGGVDVLSVLQRDMAQRYVTLQMVEDWLTGNIVEHGPLTAKGAQRAALSALLQVSDRLTRLALALGLERKARKLSPLDAVRAAVAEANQ